MTFWKVGDKVISRWDHERVGEIISIEESSKPYWKFGQKIKPVFPVEWCKIKFPDGEVKEWAGHEIRKAPEAKA